MDIKINIATANSRTARSWHNKTTTWQKLVERCRKTKVTSETLSEYLAMTKDEQSRIKDVGGFVGGYLNNGERKKGSVRFRSLATLDIDYGTPDVWDDFTMQYSCAALMYSTHKHTPEKPRLRLVIPFSRQVTTEEYEPICRKIAQEIGIELFDQTTYETPRLFFWPSTPKDGEFVFECQDGEPLNPDTVLATYINPFDVSEWPVSEREKELVRRDIRRAEDPTTKNGIIGAFCRAYTITEAIDKFLPDIYEPTATDGRYTYKMGSMAGGLVCYDDKFAWSHHETDPASGKELNAFDIVRIHKFGELDEGVNADRITAMPSYKMMAEFAASDGEVAKVIAKEKRESAREDFEGLTEEEEETDDWLNKLTVTKTGKVEDTAVNALTILENDPKFKGHLRYNEFAYYVSTPGGLPWRKEAKKWRDNDNAQLRIYLDKHYGIKGKEKIKDAKITCADRHRYHPVREYLGGLVWDGRKRAGRLLIDYLGADDCELNRHVMELWLAAAVARVEFPGCKFDHTLILSGPQGIGKSTLFEVLGGEWFNGNLSAVGQDKAVLEQLLGSWIVELQELDSFRKSEASSIKAFLTNTNDKFRGAYKEDSDDHPRQCVFAGTTNEGVFLRDDTGERRFWVVPVTGGNPNTIRNELGRIRDQIWAEAVEIFKNQPLGFDGQPVILLSSDDVEAMRKRQADASIVSEDPMDEMLDDFLETKLPPDWSSYTTADRRRYFQSEEDVTFKGQMTRTRMCPAEFVTEYLGMDATKDKEYKFKAVKVRELMNRKEGWRNIGQQRYWYGKRYANPKNVFEKSINEDDDDL